MTGKPGYQPIIFENYSMVSVNVLYRLPDYEALVNEFVWQTIDVHPKFPRIRRFLRFWRAEIDAQIKQVTVWHAPHLPNITWRSGIVLDIE